MKIVEKKFVLEADYYWDCTQMGEGVCGEWLSSVFEIPDGVKVIWLSLHDRASSNRCSVLVLKDSCGIYIVFEGGEFESAELNKVLKPFIGKRLHLQCKY